MIQQAELSPAVAASGRRSLLANLARAASANAFGLLVGLAVGLFLPRSLTFAEYSKYQTFNFYSLYLVVLQFGFTTGLYIKYGGKAQADMDRRTFTAELSLLLLLLAAATVIGLAIGLALSSPVLEAIALFLLPFNVLQCYKLLYQATGDLRRYSLLQSVECLSIGVVAFLFMALRRPDATYLIWGRVLLSAGMAGVLLRPWWRYLPCVTWGQVFSRSNLRIAQVGLLVMLGGFSSMFVHTVDRWFVKVLLTDTDFALYSFAIAMYGALSTVTNSLAMTFYPAFAGGGLTGASVAKLRRVILLAGAALCAAFFVFKLIVTTFIAKYAPSLGIISYLFVAVPVLAVVDTIYLNLYKAEKRIVRLVVVNASMVGLSVLLNFGAVWISKSTLSICLANTLAFYLWFLYCSRDFGTLRAMRRDLVFIALFAGSFLATTQGLRAPLLGLAAYLVGIGVSARLCYGPLLGELGRRGWAWAGARRAGGGI